MLRTVTEEEHKQNKKELRKFCKDNHCEMYNHMLRIKNYRIKSEHKIIDKVLKILETFPLSDKDRIPLTEIIKALRRYK